MKHPLLLPLAAALSLAGCAEHVGFHSSHLGFDPVPRLAQPSTIPCYGNRPFHDTRYTGSDAKWHYFEARHDLKLRRYKVPRAALPGWRPIFPTGKAKVHVERDARGSLRQSDR